VELPLRTAESEILSLRERIGVLTHERMRLVEELKCVKVENEDGRREREGLVFELKCARGEMEGLRVEMREERERWEEIVEKGRRDMKDREEELLTTNRILDDELRETQERVDELTRKVYRFRILVDHRWLRRRR
jgi:chromosome segregation ATPase